LEILKEIPPYGIDELYAKHSRGYNVFWHEPFFSESLNRAVLTENQPIKADFGTLLGQIIPNVNYLAWPDPNAAQCPNAKCPHNKPKNQSLVNKGQ
jgi:hypothetical protein